MNIVMIKILFMAVVFILMMLGSLMPVRIIQADYEKMHKSKKLLSICSSFGGGIFLATCFNALLPVVREKVQEVLSIGKISTDYPLGETTMMVGFFLTIFIEQLILTFRKEKPSFIDLEMINAGSEGGSDSEYESPFISSGQGQSNLYRHRFHSHCHSLNVSEVPHSSPLRLLSLVFALSAHSVFEGLALGLQEKAAKLINLFIGVAVHETLAAVALGVSMAKAAVPMKDALKLALMVSAMIPIGIGIGVGIQSANSLGSHIASVLLQGFAAGTFLFVTFFEILVKEFEDKHDRLLKVLSLIMGYGLLAGLVFLKW
ncbi:zinc transporter ZIP3-like [Narcine bancroftii]|uniref:zinc transporter ZIP3-like n=1 Tax=Narcine bancroftii TaxID=1343680 RepID=UPI003831B307